METNTNVALSVPVKRVFTIGSKTYAIRKMHVGRYAELLGNMDSLPVKLKEMFPDANVADMRENLDNLDIESALKHLPKFMQFAAMEISKIMSIATGIPEEVILGNDDTPEDEIFGLDEFLRLINTVAAINNFSEVAEQLKKLMTLRE
jgi:hypothetical protein